MIRLPPRTSLFPYTSLFRSILSQLFLRAARRHQHRFTADRGPGGLRRADASRTIDGPCRQPSPVAAPHSRRRRLEEHTSELQSRQYLVCSLLLEKKNKIIKT